METMEAKAEMKSSRIYQYSLNHPDETDLIAKVDRNLMLRNYGCFIRCCYDYLIRKERTDIFATLAIGANDNDEKAMIIIAIRKNCKEILDIVIDNGFDLNQYIDTPHGPHLDESSYAYAKTILGCGVNYHGYDMVTYLVSKGADLLFDDGSYFTYCASGAQDLIDYYIDNQIPQKHLERYLYENFYTYCDKCTYSENAQVNMAVVKKLFAYGVQLNLYREVGAIEMILSELATVTVSDYVYFIDNGLMIRDEDQNTFMSYVIGAENQHLVEYLLSVSHEVNNDVFNRLFRDRDLSINLLKFIAQFGWDFSCVTVGQEELDVLDVLEQQGLDMKVLAGMMIEQSEDQPE